MSNLPGQDIPMPEEIDFSKAVRGLHHIPLGSKILMPAYIERSVWEYYSGKATQRGIELSDLLTDRRGVEIAQAAEYGFAER